MTLARPAGAAALALLLATGAGACGPSSGSNGPTIAVESTDQACTSPASEVAAGTTTFRVQNKGTKPTELYVLGAKDKVLGEVENVGPGTARTLTVKLEPGDYDLGCKPGQSGPFVRHRIHVVAASSGARGASDTTAPPSRSVAVTAHDFDFSGDFSKLGKGDTIEVALQNQGPSEHELELVGPDGKTAEEIAPVAAGASASMVVTLAKAGVYTYVCRVADHETRGMVGHFTVG